MQPFEKRMYQIPRRGDWDSTDIVCELYRGTDIINAKTIAMMSRSAILVNTARGGLVDGNALIEALQTGAIAGAGLDVFATEPLEKGSPLLTMDNVVLSPHVAGSTLNNMSLRAARIAKNLSSFLGGGLIAKEDVVVE